MTSYLHPSDPQYLPDQTLARLGLGLSTPGLHYSVKQESRTPSPDLAAFQRFQFQFQPGSDRPQVQSNPALNFNKPIYRFGSDSPLVSSSNSWPPSSTSSIGNFNPDLMSMQNTVSFDDFEDADELSELPSSMTGRSGTGTSHEKAVRRRSSKACDQCRKSKCKCERAGDGESCKNCVMMNTPCTFLGPSRKRGPPKGYIDAIEARLHQTEALIGIMIGSNDERAQGLLEDLKKDPLAKEIIKRVDNSPYGVQGRRRDQEIQQETGGGNKNRTGNRQSRSTSPVDEASTKNDDKSHDFQSTHPTPEWQDHVSTLLRNGSRFSIDEYGDQEHTHKRQRRKISVDGFPNDILGHGTSYVRGAREGAESSSNSHSDDDIVEAVGQLSLNEDEEVRYHGKVSGLHLLDAKDRVDGRNEGGIWRFPTARVWPPLPANRQAYAMIVESNDDLSKLPDPETQEHLLELYFTYVHPSLPVIQKKSFFDVFRNGPAAVDSPESPKSDAASSASSSALNRRRQRIPTLLLLAMYAISERYSSRCSPPPQDGSMWAAGDAYLDSAKTILNNTYANSRPSTCQALLLLGYREIGIGAMAQAWVYIGMAVRMAQDLGMHRSADGWFRVGLGGKLFGEWELQERKRIWYSCVIMDKYVSTYIGRPLAIFDGDYDTLLPSDEESEEMEAWQPHPSKPVASGSWEPTTSAELGPTIPSPGRIISCFKASASLSALLGRMFVAIYGIRPASSRHTESMHFESLLDKWYIELPEQLRFEPGSVKSPCPQPHVLTLHMQYWCTVLLLHRPFIRDHKNNFDASEDDEVSTVTKKKYELCAAAANHITSIVSCYSDNYCLSRSAVFLCYYVFTASVMHVISLSKYPSDPQARVGLTKCMEALKNMEVVWPSAGRALELLRGSKVNLEEPMLSQPYNFPDRQKRAADQSFEADSVVGGGHPDNQRLNCMSARSNAYRSSSYPDLEEGFLDAFDLNTATSSTSSLPYYSSHERWPSNSYTAASFPGPLLAMPQLYNTGLVDDQAAGIRYRSQQVADDQASGSARYPQYWNDLSPFSQLSSTYGAAPMQTDQGAVPQSLYMSGQYNLYNDHSA